MTLRGDPTTLRRLYGRSVGHALSPAQKRLIADILPQYDAFAELPSSGDPLWLEIGFGRGEHLLWQADRNPEATIIGCEPFANGMVAVLGELERLPRPNVRLSMGDAIELLEAIPDAVLDRLFLLHPDPWPKLRHAKRRFMNPGPLDLVAAKLKPGGRFRVATDDVTYLRWALMRMGERRDFRWLAGRPDHWRNRPEDWPNTRYGAKALRQGRNIWLLEYERL